MLNNDTVLRKISPLFHNHAIFIKQVTFRRKKVLLMKERIPLGFIELDSGPKPVYAFSIFTDPPVEVRATDYSVLSISQNPGKVSNQIWLLAEDVQKLLPRGAFSNYVPKDEVSGATYPNASGIMFVSLKRFSQENTVAGELASSMLRQMRTILLNPDTRADTADCSFLLQSD